MDPAPAPRLSPRGNRTSGHDAPRLLPWGNGTKGHDMQKDRSQADTVEDPRSLSVSESWALVRTAVIGRLAIVSDGAPDIFPVNFLLDHGTVVIRTAAGTKYDGARSCAAAFEVDGYDPATGEAWSVVLKGEASVVRDSDDVITLMNASVAPWHPGIKPHFLRLVPADTSGRSFPVAGGSRTTSQQASGPTTTAPAGT